MYSYEQQRSILSKFVAVRQKTAQPTSSSWYTFDYKCKYCESKKSDSPPILTSDYRLWCVWTNNTNATLESLGTGTSERTRYESIETLAEHLTKHHDISPCEICGDMITRRGLTRHRKSPDCTAEFRRYTMRLRNLDLLGESSINLIHNAVKHKRLELEQHIPWDDENIINHIEFESVKAVNELTNAFGIKQCLTQWDPKTREYKKEYWAPPLVGRMLDLYNSTLPWREVSLNPVSKPDPAKVSAFFDMMNQWLDGNEDTQDAIVCILEMQKESNDG